MMLKISKEAKEYLSKVEDTLKDDYLELADLLREVNNDNEIKVKHVIFAVNIINEYLRLFHFDEKINIGKFLETDIKEKRDFYFELYDKNRNKKLKILLSEMIDFYDAFLEIKQIVKNNKFKDTIYLMLSKLYINPKDIITFPILLKMIKNY